MTEEAQPSVLNDLVQSLIWYVVVPYVVIVALRVAVLKASAYVASLWVEGAPNEWVLLMRNGEMVRAAIGLRCFRGPFDQVARFPAKIYKCNFEAEQVTSEMQGVKVTGMLVWTINRMKDGPFNAYKNLGDISSGNPRSANDSLTAEASAVVRGCIANSTIEVMIRDRNMLRDAIRKEMFEVVKGWGVWLETIEITDVKISSQALFKDLQTKYREDMRQTATIHKMEIQQEIDQERTKNALEVAEKEREQQEQIKIYQQRVEQEKKEVREQFLRDKADIYKVKEELAVQHSIKIQGLNEDLARQLKDVDLQLQLQNDQTKIKKQQESQRLTAELNVFAQKGLEQRLEDQKIRKECDNEIELAMMELEKTNTDE